MAADQALIKMAKELAASKGYNDIGNIIDTELERWNTQIDTLATNRVKINKEQDDRYIKYIEDLPNLDIPKIPPEFQEAAIEKTKGWRDDYADAAKRVSEMNPRDEGYSDAVSEMNTIEKKFENIHNQFSQLVDMKIGDAELVQGGLVSNSSTDRDIRTNALIGEGTYSIDDNGSLNFSTGDKTYTLTELPKLNQVDTEFQSGLIKMAVAADKNKQPTSPGGEKTLRMQLSLLIGNDRNSILSAATDNVIDGGDPAGIPDDLLTDPTRTDELKEAVIDYYTGTLMAIEKGAYQEVQEGRDDLHKSNRTGKYEPAKDPKQPSMKEWLLLQSIDGDGGLPPTPTAKETDIQGVKTAYQDGLENEIDTMLTKAQADRDPEEVKALTLKIAKLSKTYGQAAVLKVIDPSKIKALGVGEQ